MPSHMRSLRRNRRAASPAVSMVIITAATVTLVLIAGAYALQVIERERASSEFEAVTKSMLTFDDAVRDIAWDREGSRSVRFTTNYGIMQLLPSNKKITISGPGGFSKIIETGVVKYSMPTSQFTLGSETAFYILGNASTGVFSPTESFGQALVSQDSGFATISLNYRVRISQEGPATTVGSTDYTYVDILVIRLNCDSVSVGAGDFDLTAKNVGLSTEVFGPVATTGGSIIVDSQSDHPFPLQAGDYMFSVIIADVRVSP